MLRTSSVELMVAARGAEADEERRWLSWRSAGVDVIVVDQGDAEGVVSRGPDGSPTAYTYEGESSYLLQDGALWAHVADSPSAAVFPADRAGFFGVTDIREWGLSSALNGKTFEQRCVEHGYPAPRYTVERDKGYWHVTATSNGASTEWWIDPDRGWNIVRCASSQSGKLVSEVRLTVDRFGDIWFPRRVEYWLPSYDASSPMRVYEVHHAEFNESHHPSMFSPSSIGVEVGASIKDQGGESLYDGLWDGQRVVSSDEFELRRKAGELKPGPSIERANARARATRLDAEQNVAHQRQQAQLIRQAGGAAALRLSSWERYTLAFIHRHRLDPGQTQRAKSILKDCQDQAAAYLARRKRDFEALEAARARLLITPVTVDASTFSRDSARLFMPLDEIERVQLKPRLVRLLTTNQKAAATQPARTSAGAAIGSSQP